MTHALKSHNRLGLNIMDAYRNRLMEVSLMDLVVPQGKRLAAVLFTDVLSRLIKIQNCTDVHNTKIAAALHKY
jgi:hypothetical protein